MDYLKAFVVGGLICMLGQILIDKTKLTPARILVCYVVLGVILGGAGVYLKSSSTSQARAQPCR